MVATVRRCEDIYNRTDKPSVTFCEKEEASKQAEKEQTKKRPAIKLNALVEATGFEPAAPWSQTRCATKLRHASLSNRLIIHIFLGFVKIFLVISRQFDG